MDHLMTSSSTRKTDIRKACNNCIRAKAACDNNRPCFRCLSHKIADSCANVPRKHNVAKRKRIGENGETEDHNDHLQFSLSYMINNSLNSIINNLNNNGNNNYQTMPHVEGEVNGHSMVNNVINTAIQNLNSRSTSAIISDTISNLNHYNPINQAVGSMSFDSPQPPPKSVASQEVDYESVLQWLQSAATNVPAPMAPAPPPLHPSRSTPSTPTPTHTPTPTPPTLPTPPLCRSSPQLNSFAPPQPPEDHHAPYDYSSYSFAPPHPKHIHTPPIQSQQHPTQHNQPTTTHSPSQTPSSSQSILLLNHSPSQSTPNHSPSQIPIPSPSQQPTPPQHSTPPSPSLGVSQSPSISDPDSPTLPDPLISDVPPLPTLNITIYTKTNRNTAAAYSYVSNLLKHSPMGNSGLHQDAEAPSNDSHPHNISIPSCSAASLVQTLSLLRQYSAIDMNSPIHIDYTYKSIPLKMQPVGLIEMTGPSLVDCNDAFGQVFGFKTGHELMSQNRPVGDYMLPEGIAISRRTVDLFFRLKTAHLERYQVFLLRNRPARVFLAQHELVGSRHRTVTFLEEYPDFPLCFFSDWIKTILPNAVLPPCDRPYCHCKYPDEYLKIA
eukprot:Phypoly_transcript_04451.p1 GENE.Phypoly_transcript_04451~~Phypoly_transcript_04451.p1  ORF type:complete len:607 (+),score=85.39 Phypoly_transcript_04451:127-1947(+)